MNREEQLKEAIAEVFTRHRFTSPSKDNIYFKSGIETALTQASILRHADPEIMKAAGWVREEEIMPDVKRILLLCEENGKPVDGFAFRQSVLSLREIIPLPQPPEKYKP